MSDVDSEAQAWHDFKVERMAEWIGKQHELVLHAIIPYAIGGALDEYFFDFHGQGTAVATMELSELPGSGPGNSIFQCYELAMFTRFPFDVELAQDETSLHGAEYQRITSFLNALAPYCSRAKIERFDTCEFPPEMDEIGGRCLVFDAMGSEIGPSRFGIMVPIEIFRNEMLFAQEEGGDKLIELLKRRGFYPFSSQGRPSVI